MEIPKLVLAKSSSHFPPLLSPQKSDISTYPNLNTTLSTKPFTTSFARTRPLVLSTTPKAQSQSKYKLLKQAGSTKSITKQLLSKPKPETLKFPLSCEELLNLIPDLPLWTKSELETHERIFYFFKPTKTISPNFTDDKGDYKLIIGDDLAYRYEIIDTLGKGTFGQVAKVFDHCSNKEFAVKIIKDRQRYTEQAQAEIEMLQFFRDSQLSEYLIKIENSFTFRSHTVIVLELLSSNLYELLKRNSFRGLSNNLIKKFSGQILEALSSLSLHRIIHCDLKPENILVTDSNFSSVKLIDFGTSCYANNRIYTYIQSRFYRAPEIVLGIPYTDAIDLWSFGCVLVELYTGLPIFQADNEKELMCRVVEVLGEPPIELLEQASRAKVFFSDEGQLKVRSKNGKRSLRAILKGADEEMVELVEECLKWKPADRVCAEGALRCRWFYSESGEKKGKKRYKISLEEITKNAPKLQKYLSGKIRN